MRTISITSGRRRLFALWTISCGLLFLLLITQSILNPDADQARAQWEWFLPSVMPTLSLIVGVFVSTERSSGNLDIMIYRVAFWGSVLYLMMVSIVPTSRPFQLQTPAEIMRMSHLWQGPFQGITAAAVGVFFAKSRVVKESVDEGR